MAKIIKLEETEVVIASQNHSAIRVPYEALDFKPKLGEHVEVYYDDKQVIVLQMEEPKSKETKSFYQHVWFWLLLIAVIGVLAYQAGKVPTGANPAPETTTVESQTEELEQETNQAEILMAVNEKLTALTDSLQEELAQLKLKVEELKNKLEEQQNKPTESTEDSAATDNSSQ